MLRTGTHERLLCYSGASMHPTLRPGDAMVVEPADWASIERGDVVVFERTEGLIVHRVVERRPDHLITRGDARWRDDDPVPRTALVGRVSAVVREGRELPVPGPAVARAGAFQKRLRNNARAAVASFLRPVYVRLAREQSVRAWCRRLTGLEVSYLSVRYPGGGSVIQALVRERVVARYFPETGRWWCHAPYRLLVEPLDRLPAPPPDRSAPAPADRG